MSFYLESSFSVLRCVFFSCADITPRSSLSVSICSCKLLGRQGFGLTVGEGTTFRLRNRLVVLLSALELCYLILLLECWFATGSFLDRSILLWWRLLLFCFKRMIVSVMFAVFAKKCFSSIDLFMQCLGGLYWRGVEKL